MEGKLEGVYITAYRDKDFYGGYSEIAVSMFVSPRLARGT